MLGFLTILHALVLAAYAGVASTMATQGCMMPTSNLAGSSRTGSLTFDGQRRTFIIDFPSTYSQAAMRSGAPLIVAFHGATRDPKYIRTMTQFSNPKLNPDHVVVYPQGINDYWQGSPYAAPGVNDIGFINRLLNKLSSEYCLNTSKFFATGHSNGGGFTNTIACWPGLSGRFAAFAPFSAAVYVGSRGPKDECKPDHRMTPMLEMHGQSDAVIPYNGGSVANGMDTTPPVLYWLRHWVLRNGCSDDTFKSNIPFPGKVTRWTSDQCSVRHFAFKAMPHAWPCNSTIVPQGDFKTPIEGTATAMAWFRAHS